MTFLLSLIKFTCNEKVNLLSFAASCTSQQTKNNKKNTEMRPEKNEDGEWELHVLDPGYESFLISRARLSGNSVFRIHVVEVMKVF